MVILFQKLCTWRKIRFRQQNLHALKRLLYSPAAGPDKTQEKGVYIGDVANIAEAFINGIAQHCFREREKKSSGLAG